MATKVYESDYIMLVDGTEVFVTPLKIKYLREFMTAFENVKGAVNDDAAIDGLVECARICMKQYFPEISKSTDLIEDAMTLKDIYRLLDISAGIKVNEKSEEPVQKQATQSGSTWETLDLAKLESEAFLLGIWKDYEELETSMSMPEIMSTLSVKRELDYAEKKFLAAMQGVDLDKESGKQDEWEAMKARVYSKGAAKDPNDILALQGQNAANKGFGIGMGLTYEKID
jgi:hypothetical protein